MFQRIPQDGVLIPQKGPERTLILCFMEHNISSQHKGDSYTPQTCRDERRCVAR